MLLSLRTFCWAKGIRLISVSPPGFVEKNLGARYAGIRLHDVLLGVTVYAI